MNANIRKMLVVVEETCREMDRAVNPVTRKAVAFAVVDNPCAGKFVEDLEILMRIGAELGDLLGRRAVAALRAGEQASEQVAQCLLPRRNQAQDLVPRFALGIRSLRLQQQRHSHQGASMTANPQSRLTGWRRRLARWWKGLPQCQPAMVRQRSVPG